MDALIAFALGTIVGAVTVLCFIAWIVKENLHE